MRFTLAAIVTFLLLAAPAAASTPAEILKPLAANQTHSWVHDTVGLEEMRRIYESGERLYVTCGHVAELARRLLRDAGYPARVVQVITRDPFDYVNDGHLMTEVFYEGRWQLWDLDANVRAVDANGQGVQLVDQLAAVKAGTALWESIADDSLVNENEPDRQMLELARRIFSDPEGFYRHVMGDALLPADPQGRIGRTYFSDAQQADRLHALVGGLSRTLASAEEWLMLTTTTDVPIAPAPAKPKSKTVAAPPRSVPVTAVARVAARAAGKHRACQRLRRRYRRTHTRKARARYARCKARTRSRQA